MSCPEKDGQKYKLRIKDTTIRRSSNRLKCVCRPDNDSYFNKLKDRKNVCMWRYDGQYKEYETFVYYSNAYNDYTQTNTIEYKWLWTPNDMSTVECEPSDW